MHESADTSVDGEVIGTSQDIQNQAERLRIPQGDLIEGERPSVLVHGQLMTYL